MTCIHRARGGEQHPGREAQVVKDARQLGGSVNGGERSWRFAPGINKSVPTHCEIKHGLLETTILDSSIYETTTTLKRNMVPSSTNRTIDESKSRRAPTGRMKTKAEIISRKKYGSIEHQQDSFAGTGRLRTAVALERVAGWARAAPNPSNRS